MGLVAETLFPIGSSARRYRHHDSESHFESRLSEEHGISQKHCKHWMEIILAERGGFEPPIRFNPYNGLANRRLQPLGHLSILPVK